LLELPSNIIKETDIPNRHNKNEHSQQREVEYSGFEHDNCGRFMVGHCKALSSRVGWTATLSILDNIDKTCLHGENIVSNIGDIFIYWGDTT